MATAKEHGRTVLAGIIPARIDLYSEAFKELTPEHFTDLVQAKIFSLLEFYYQKTGGILTSGALTDLLTRGGMDAGRKALFEETYEDLKTRKVDDADFIWAVHELREDYAEGQIKAVLTDTMEIVTKGKELPDGGLLKGQEEARAYVMERMADLDAVQGFSDTPHGSVKDETRQVAQEYTANKLAREKGLQTGIKFGIPELDAKVDGIQRGDLALTAAYTNEGKTSLCIQLAWSAAVEQGKNVLFLSTETVKDVVRRKLVSRHSVAPKFLEFGLPDGLNSKDFKMSTFNPHEEELLVEVLQDLANPMNEYGEMYIYQLPRQASVMDIERIMIEQQRKFDIDLVICDYLQLLRPLGRRDTDRESLAGVLKGTKQLSVSFNKGRGVPFVSPWQVNRASKEQADSVGRYMPSALSETAEATNTPDIIVSMLAPAENNDRHASLMAQVLKHRDGETADGIQLRVDYATCSFSGQGTLDTFSNASFATSSAGGIDSII